MRTIQRPPKETHLQSTLEIKSSIQNYMCTIQWLLKETQHSHCSKRVPQKGTAKRSSPYHFLLPADASFFTSQSYAYMPPSYAGDQKIGFVFNSSGNQTWPSDVHYQKSSKMIIWVYSSFLSPREYNFSPISPILTSSHFYANLFLKFGWNYIITGGVL